MYGRCTRPSGDGLIGWSGDGTADRCTGLPLSWGDHGLAILVYQGSDPTVPYQALVIRESARLSLGFAPWQQ